MPQPRGQGPTLGAALNSLLADFGVQPKGRLASYKAKTWHAQLVHLTHTHRGYTALEEAGLHVTHATLMKWLSDDEYNVRRSYREIIHQAYEAAATISADPILQAFKDHQFEIRGIVKTGADERDRGAHGTAPLRIDGRNGHWASIEAMWRDGELGDAAFEDDFIDFVICDDIGEGTDGWAFPGGTYTIT
ncbi:hypothetical protein OG453_44145 [Streptomyces sp. NBC_01381]|uniref:hypothetical protein n=1 Tax=Streptomyces sp. NBC_01381 TaxID=2903845 RepID=UPI00225969D0|nr:hypothetical protein [Streptomyces sp. NBC_01381]MCX4673551.1 hypothetical protein [Streptomyces sp. NBC_01381]